MWRVTADNGQCRCEGYRRGWFASLGFDFGGGVAVLGRGKATSKDSANVVSTQVYKVTLPNPLAQWLPQVA
jgi:hypothetical protein